MNLKDILAVSGEATLFKFVAQGKNAVIIENLETSKRISAGATARVSALDEIAIFTTGEDIPLGRVMDLLWEKENGGEALSHKMPDTDLKLYFAEVLPEYDRDRVYTSDIKKVLLWYNILQKLNLLIKEEEKPEDQAAESGDGAVQEEAPEAGAEGKAVAKSKTKIETETGEKVRKAQAPKGRKSKPAEER